MHISEKTAENILVLMALTHPGPCVEVAPQKPDWIAPLKKSSILG